MRFESDVARTDEELTEVEQRMWAILDEKLGEQRLLVYTAVTPATAAASA